MNDAPAAVLSKVPESDLPLSVLLFNAAMQKGIALSEFADELGIGAISLRQFISGQTQRPRSSTLQALAYALNMSVDEVRRRAAMRPTSAPVFAEWLKAQMHTGTFSRARLTQETRISDGALRNYLAGRTLPDTDQAQRLAETLKVETLELARVLVADQTVRAGGETVPPPPPPVEQGAVGLGAGGDIVTYPVQMGETLGDEAAAAQRTNGGTSPSTNAYSSDDDRLLSLWRQLHPQGRRATLIYIAGLLAEG